VEHEAITVVYAFPQYLLEINCSAYSPIYVCVCQVVSYRQVYGPQHFMSLCVSHSSRGPIVIPTLTFAVTSYCSRTSGALLSHLAAILWTGCKPKRYRVRWKCRREIRCHAKCQCNANQCYLSICQNSMIFTACQYAAGYKASHLIA
jgi:hypothetical protein